LHTSIAVKVGCRAAITETTMAARQNWFCLSTGRGIVSQEGIRGSSTVVLDAGPKLAATCFPTIPDTFPTSRRSAIEPASKLVFVHGFPGRAGHLSNFETAFGR
jgi:hypothetical protein